MVGQAEIRAVVLLPVEQGAGLQEQVLAVLLAVRGGALLETQMVRDQALAGVLLALVARVAVPAQPMVAVARRAFRAFVHSTTADPFTSV